MEMLDLCCGLGGAAVGYARAGFKVTGVDLLPQPDFPYEFWCMNALALDYEKLRMFDFIHVSPPCQEYSRATAVPRKHGKSYPDLYRPFKAMLIASGKPYIIENVVGSPVKGIGLCGTMFGLGVFRHRIFESNIPLSLPATPCTCTSKRIGEGYVTVAGDASTKLEALAAMQIDWVSHKTLKWQVNQAIPPAYTEFLGKQAIEHLAPGHSSMRTRSSRNYERQLLIQPPLW